MAIESGLSQQVSTFTDSLNIKPAPTVEKTVDEAGQDTKIPEQGDTVSISQEAKALAAAEKPGATGQTDEEQESTVVEQLEERIEKLEEEIKEIEDDDELPEKEKAQQIQAKQAELMELRDQLLKAQQEELDLQGMADGGGTRANGFGNSASSF